MTSTDGSFHVPPTSAGRLVTTMNATLPLQSMHLSVDACAGIARVVVEQRFRNAHESPLAVTYAFPLPADATVSGYSFRIGDRRIVGEIARREEARDRFERALVEGKAAALLEQDRTSLFTQEIGNVPPGAEVVVELTLDQPLSWLDEGSWEWRFPTAAAPRYLGQAGRVPDAARVALDNDVTEDPLAARASLALQVRDTLTTGRVPESPSHRLRVAEEGAASRVTLDDPARLDRDIVVRWPVTRRSVGLTVDAGRPAASAPNGRMAYGVLTIVPPSAQGRPAAVARDLIVLLDTSGSMSGGPLDQARRIVSSIVDTLGEHDQLELVEFSSQARRWKSHPVPATPAHRAEALTWLANLRASGGTEMREGIYEALRPLRVESQRQVVLVTDGLIGFEAEVIRAIVARLPPGSRLHTVGVGSAVNRSLTGPVARVGRGVEVVVGLGEDVERAAQRIVARTSAPLVVDVELSGSALLEHSPLPDLFAGAPVVVGVSLRPEGGELVVRGRTTNGTWEDRVQVPVVPPASGNPAAAALFGRAVVEDLEVALASGKESSGIEPQIERVGLHFSLATRRTSWVAVSEEPTVDPREPLKRVRIPQELPYGMSAEGLGLRTQGQMLVGQAVTRSTGAPRPAGGMPAPLMRASVPRGLGAPPPQGHASRGGPPPSPMRAMVPPPAPAKSRRDDEDEALRTIPAPAQPRHMRVLRGRLVLRKDDEIVVEVLVEGEDLDWDPAFPGARLTLDDGTVGQATLVVERTTRAGLVRQGQSLRLVLRLGGHWATLANLPGLARSIALTASDLVIEL
jgi:Ca-activated chloride channel family protein